MTLTFNIVYTAGTVPYLNFFVSSLLNWSDCRFRLVSNGCLYPERMVLQQMSMANDRLQYLTVPTNGVADHGTILNYLQAITDDDYFCFMDSDLFATEDFLTELRPHLDGQTAFFSGGPLWTTLRDGILPAEFQTVSGVHHQTNDGICLGSSYFAIYDNRQLTECMQSTGVGFQTHQWHEIPAHVQQLLLSRGWQKHGYDTAKVLNLLLQERGAAMKYVDLESLCHIGGFSFLPMQPNTSTTLKSRVVDRVMSSPLRRIIAPVQNLWRSHKTFQNADNISDPERQAIMARRTKQRDPTRRYFHKLLTALNSGQALPERPLIGISVIDTAVETATKRIIELWRNDQEAARRRVA